MPMVSDFVRCTGCNGGGKVRGIVCFACHGSGRVPQIYPVRA